MASTLPRTARKQSEKVRALSPLTPTDVKMPVMSGMDAFLKIKELPATSSFA